MKQAKYPHPIFNLFSFSESILEKSSLKSLYLWDIGETFFKELNKSYSISSTISTSVHFLQKELVFIGKGVTIAPGALIEGPCYIGDNVCIGHNAYIRKGTILCEHVKIGHSSEINRSIMLMGSCAPHFNYVGDSILGKNVNLGAHATLANLRLDKKDITVRFEKEKLFSRRRKIGSFIGDNASIGCGSVLNPGTVIEQNVTICPLTIVSGFRGEAKC